jgi:hypothetical protein
MSHHVAAWTEVERLLRSARTCLALNPKAKLPTDGLLRGTLEEFEEFLAHNELELAWDALAEVAEEYSAPPDCWRELAQAAALMQLPTKQETAERHLPRSTTSDQSK